MDNPATNKSLVLLVGAPRSGTTWLQTMLGAHPMIASPQETDLFSQYLGLLSESWRRHVRGTPADWAERRFKGLPAVITHDELVTLGRAFVDTLVERVTELKPGATIVLEKSPSHSKSAATVAEFAPETRVIHLIRDGRDVASSLMAAAEGWGSVWAPASLKRAARAWVDGVRGARCYAELGIPYLELRYEALRSADAPLLREVHAFCGVELSEVQSKELLEEFSFDRMSQRGDETLLVGGEFAPYAAERREPAGFFRKGAVGGWRAEWSETDRLLFDGVAGDLLVELGYEANSSWAAGPMRTRSFHARAAVLRKVAAAGRKIGARADRLVRELP